MLPFSMYDSIVSWMVLNDTAPDPAPAPPTPPPTAIDAATPKPVELIVAVDWALKET